MGYPIPFRNRFFDQPSNNPMEGNYGSYNFKPPIEEEEQNTFEPFQMPNTAQPTNFADVYKEFMNRQNGPAMSEYSKFVQSGPPREEDFKPNKWGKLGAILSGLSTAAAGGDGGEATRRSMERPYHKALAKHGMQGNYLREAANLENASVSKQLQIMNSMREAENQKADNERDNTRLALSIRQGNLSMQESIIRLATAGKRYETDKGSGILYLIDELTFKKTPIGKFDLSSGERIKEATDQARSVAKATDPIIRGRQKDLQNSAQEFSRAQQDRQFANNRESVNQINDRNNLAVDNLIRTNPEKFKEIYVWDQQTQTFAIDNPLKDRGVGVKNGVAVDGSGIPLTDEEIAKYNAFVELHNVKSKGISDQNMLSPLPTSKQSTTPSGRFQIIKPQSSSRYGKLPYPYNLPDNELEKHLDSEYGDDVIR